MTPDLGKHISVGNFPMIENKSLSAQRFEHSQNQIMLNFWEHAGKKERKKLTNTNKVDERICEDTYLLMVDQQTQVNQASHMN